MKRFIAGLKLAGLIVVEVLAVTYPIAAVTFWLCYLGDIMWGQHLMVNTADKWFTGCLILGLACGLGCSIWHTRKIIANLRGNNTVK